jgi:DNA-binding MarR family transcriptional regulator
MTLVKRLYDQTLNLDDFEPKHMGYLLERITKRMRDDLGKLDGAAGMRQRHLPLSPSYYRVAMLVPVGGARLTDLAVPAGMTKQALGQFVDVLDEHGYVTVARSDDDRRARIVRRTPKGDELVLQMTQLYDRLHADWREVLGAQRWKQFYDALVDLSTGWEDAPG